MSESQGFDGFAGLSDEGSREVALSQQDESDEEEAED